MTRRLMLAAPFALLASLVAGCAAAPEGPTMDTCYEAEQACRTQCDAEFETNPSAWDYQSCLASCEPKPGAVCR